MLESCTESATFLDVCMAAKLILLKPLPTKVTMDLPPHCGVQDQIDQLTAQVVYLEKREKKEAFLTRKIQWKRRSPRS